jgi:hypothetical protein
MARFHTNDKSEAHKMVLEAAEISGLRRKTERTRLKLIARE